jgi:hypothetical protein
MLSILFINTKKKIWCMLCMKIKKYQIMLDWVWIKMIGNNEDSMFLKWYPVLTNVLYASIFYIILIYIISIHNKK